MGLASATSLTTRRVGSHAAGRRRAQSVARSMTDSQWGSAGRLSLWATAGDSAGGRPVSRSRVIGVTLPEEMPRPRAGALGGQLDPLLNMVLSDRHESGQREPRVFRGARTAQHAQLA